jgi:Spy/CpxP family protein refolding chaperone
MTFPFKSICKLEGHPYVTNDGDIIIDEVTDSVWLSTSGRTTTTTTNSTVVAAAAASTNSADVTSTDTPDVAAPGRKKRFMIIDETKLSKEEAERLLIKRAYNRECAERARKRSKETVQELHRQVEELQADKCELRQQLTQMEKEIQRLKDKNKVLMLSRLTRGADDMPYTTRPTIGNHIDDCASPLNSYTKPITALSVLQQSMGTDGSHPNLGTLLPSWDVNKLLLLQRTRRGC